MASTAYYIWVADGKPYRLCRPAAALQRNLRAHGLTVYDYPNDAHLKAEPPEDHTPFSATGWPGTNAYGIGHADDIMPRDDSYAARKENADIARRLIADRNAGVPGALWIKYINWTDENGACRQERWTPNHETRPSTDKGHIHVSARSDCDNDARAEDYDPLEVDVEQSDRISPATPDNNSVGDGLNIAVQVRRGMFFDDSQTGYGTPKPASALGKIYARLDGLAAKVDAIQVGQVSQEVVTAAVVAALQDPAVFAVLVAAANKAEDS